MGREIKRVPSDFDWPIGEVWTGYLNPHAAESHECQQCSGSGYSKEAEYLKNQWYGNAPFTPSEPYTAEHPIIMERAKQNVEAMSLDQRFNFYHSINTIHCRWLEAARLARHFNSWMHHLDQDDVDALVAANRLWDFTRAAINDEQAEIVKQKMADGGNSWLPFDNGYHPTAQQVNEWSMFGFGHDSSNQWICVSAKCKRLGINENCPSCGGAGHLWSSPEAEERFENWERDEPPTGEGWQVWETVSEGSPISPVFATGEELVTWLVDEGYSEDSSRSFVFERQWSPSMVMVDGKMYNDIESVNK